MIVHNWLAFDEHPTGARRRAVELHSRINEPSRILITSRFPAEDRARMPWAHFSEVASSRSRYVRAAECFAASWDKWCSHDPFDAWVTETLPVIRFRRAKSIFAVHDLRFLEGTAYLGRERHLLYSLFLRRSLANAYLIIAISEWTSQVLQNQLGIAPERIRVVPAGVTGPRFSVKPADLGTPYILTVGHLESRKNQIQAIEALSECKSFDGELVIVGRDLGSGATLRNRIAELKLDARVRLMENVSDPELASLYQGAEAVICPSRYEGFGITLLEAFQHKRPVIASAIGPHLEVAAGSARWFDPIEGGASELAECIDEITSSPDRGKVLNGLERVDRFSWDRAARKLEKVYAELG